MPPDDPPLDVELSGQIRVPHATAQKLVTAAGRWRMLPSPPDLIMLRRDGTRPSVMFSGLVDDGTVLPDIFNFLHMAQLEGTLEVLGGTTRRTLYFKRGQVISAASSLAEDRLGALLVRFGLVTEEQLVSAAKEATPQRRLGQVLVESGLMTSHDLFEGVKRQAEEIFFAVLLARDGVFYFSRPRGDEQLPAKVQLDTQGLLLDGLRRMDEMSYFRAKVSSSSVVLALRPDAPTAKVEGAPGQIQALVDGTRTLAEIARMTHLGEFVATKATYELIQTGRIEVRQGPEMVRGPVQHAPAAAASALQQTAALAAIVRAYNEALGMLYPAIATKGKANALRQGVGAFLAGSARFATLFKDASIGADGTLEEDTILDNLEDTAAPQRMELLQKGMAELLSFVLFVAGDAVAPDEESRLTARVADVLRAVT